MAKNSYEWMLVETMENPGGECSREEIRLRPVGHPVYPSSMRVSCSRQIRRKTAPGDRFLLWCCLEARGKYLYIHPDREWHPVNDTQARQLLRGETISIAGHPVNLGAPLARTYPSFATPKRQALQPMAGEAHLTCELTSPIFDGYPDLLH